MPKLKFTIEFSRSGYMQITKAMIVGGKQSSGQFVNIKTVRKAVQLTEE